MDRHVCVGSKIEACAVAVARDHPDADPRDPDTPGRIFALATYRTRQLVWAEAEGFYKTPVIPARTAGGDVRESWRSAASG